MGNPEETFERIFGTAGIGRKVDIRTIRAMGVAMWRSVPMSESTPGSALICGNGAGFSGGGRAQGPSLPMDDPLTSDEKGVCFSYTQS